MKWWEALIGVAIVTLLVLVVVGSYLSRKKCQEKGGVYLARDMVCAKPDLFIK